MKLLLDEMYQPALADALRDVGITVFTVVELRLAGSSDPEIFAAAITDGYTLVTENVADFTRISGGHLNAGRHHPGVLIALSSRFSRRPSGIAAIVSAICAVADQKLEDRLLYLQSPSER